MSELTRQEIQQFDSDGMLNRILSFPQQMQTADEIARAASLDIKSEQIRNVCVVGMGGSAIGGDVARMCFADALKIPYIVNRYYNVSNFVDENTLVIISSYSGKTEETLSSYREARERKAQIVCISSGGTLSEEAKRSGHAVISIPGGAPPRSALGYLAVPLIYTLHTSGLIPDPSAQIQETIDLLEKLRSEYSPESDANLAKEIARKLQNKIPLIFASVDRFEAAAMRWKGQFSENSKVLAFCNVFPELNHNEVVGWGPLANVNKNFQAIYLRDKEDHDRVQKRMALTRTIIEKQSGTVIEVESRGDAIMARIFSLIFLGDMTSFYLAILNRVDPTAIKNIDFIKSGLQD